MGARKNLLIIALFALFVKMFTFFSKFQSHKSDYIMQLKPLSFSFIGDKINVNYSDHDPSLQNQLIEVHDSKNLSISMSIYPWKAICDERNDSFNKAVVIFAFAHITLAPYIEEISQIMDCDLYSNYEEKLSSGKQIFKGNGFLMFFFFFFWQNRWGKSPNVFHHANPIIKYLERKFNCES